MGNHSAAARACRIAVQIEHHTRIVVLILEGIVTFADLALIEQSLRTIPEYQSGYSLLADTTAVTEMRLHGDEMYFLAERTEWNSNYAAIAAAEPLIAGLARIYATAANWRTERVCVFPDIMAAKEWLANKSSSL